MCGCGCVILVFAFVTHTNVHILYQYLLLVYILKHYLKVLNVACFVGCITRVFLMVEGWLKCHLIENLFVIKHAKLKIYAIFSLDVTCQKVKKM